MATKFVEIDIKEAEHLADLTGIVLDFKMTKRFAEQHIEMLDGGVAHRLHEPMTIAILVRYSRPFASGVRHSLTKRDLEGLSPKQRESHDQFLNWRNKHIAHSVNIFEENQPVARYWVERFDDEGFTSVECNSTQLVGMSLCDVKMIIELATYFIKILKPQVKCENEKVLKVVNSLPREEILKMEKPVKVSSIKDVNKVRQQNR